MSIFYFKHFSVSQANTTMKVGTDAMLLGSLVSLNGQPCSVLDIGTGTGVIALMIAQRFENALVMALEIDQSACQEAEQNFTASPWSNRLASIEEDVLEIEFDSEFDLIVSNPPYYENSLLSENDRTSRAKHAEFLPVDLLVTKVESMLSENGTFWVIVPSENATSWIDYASKNGLNVHSSISIIGKEGLGEKRRILAFGREEVEVETSNMTIREQSGKYTKDYIELTKEFHDRDLS